MIQTQLGPVGLRKPRETHQEITLKGDTKKITIKKAWLRPDPKQKKVDSEYRSKVMQAMLLAAYDQKIQDLAGRFVMDPATGYQMTPQQVAQRRQEYDKTREKFKDGKATVPLKALHINQALEQQGFKQMHKNVLMRRGAKMGMLDQRFFTIDNGKLKVFRSQTITAKARKVYSLHDCVCNYEEKGLTLGVAEDFKEPYNYRVKVQLAERPHGPIYLLASDARTAKSWERAIKMSKYLKEASDREAISFVVGRLAGSVMQKGWAALFVYANEIWQTRKLVKNFSMRLMRVDDSRGWTKLRLVYQSIKETERRKLEGQRFAASFLKERMDRITSQAARHPHQVRAMIVQQLQSKFRQYRQEMIFDRKYPLGSSVSTRLQQAQAGTALGAYFTSLSAKDTLQLVLDPTSFEMLTGRQDMVQSKKSRYSEVQVPVSRLNVSVAESLAMLSFSEIDEQSEHSQLAKAGWAHFVNIDQISSVVLHSERMMGKDGKRHELQSNMTKGSWFTINGPRVCWGRKIRSRVDPKTKEETRHLVGAADGQAVGLQLAKGERARMFRVLVSLKSTSVFRPDTDPEEINMDDEMGPDGSPPSSRSKDQWQTFMVVHVLGRKFKTEKVLGNNPSYSGRFEAEVPISQDEQALAVVDESEISIEIVQAKRDPRFNQTVWAGKIPLWKVFGPEENIAERAERAAQRVLGMEEEEAEEVVSLAQTLGGRSGRATKSIKLVTPGMTGTDAFLRQAAVVVEVSAGIRVSEANEPRIISPELQGRGPITTLFGSQKGAWFDPKIGDANFFSEMTDNFVELSFKELAFPSTDRNVDRLHKYRIDVRCKGVQASTVALHRAVERWKWVIPVDPNKIDFQGAKLFLPIPPGAWCTEVQNPEDRLHVEVSVHKCLQEEAPIMSLGELLRANGKTAGGQQTWERVYHAKVFLEGLQSLEKKSRTMNIPLTKVNVQPTKVLLGDGHYDENVSAADAAWLLDIDATLRDRDYVMLRDRESVLARGEQRGSVLQGLGQTCVLCAGDKAMLKVEEPLVYPKDEVEFRRRFVPGTFEQSQRGKTWMAKLRDPSMSHEMADSRLDKMPEPPAFKQKYLPTHSDDVIPYKFVLPNTELEYMKEARPGVFWRVVDHIASKKVQENKEPPEKHSPLPVEEISHLIRHAPCTVLAVYANNTCDLELSPSFMDEWEKNHDKRFSIPGAVQIREFKDTSARAIMEAPVGAGDVGERLRRRVILRYVPLASVVSVQSSGFNVYDAAFTSTEDAIKVHPADMGNDFNPRLGVDFEDISFYSGKKGAYALHPGPLPVDAGPTCQYEWQLHLQAPSEDDMYQFVTNLRQCMRMHLFQEMQKLEQFERKSHSTAKNMMYHMGPILSTKSGHLEVVLVEAKNLRPAVVQKDVDMMVYAKRMIEPDLNCLVSFKLRHTGPDGQQVELMYRGSKTQFSCQIAGSNPSWADLPDTKGSGGWTFKSNPIEPDNYRDLEMVLDVKHKGTRRVGFVTIPVVNEQNKEESLCDPDRPFRNIWKPLYEIDPETQTVAPKASGEIHIMTLWVPTQERAKTKRLPKTPQAWKMYELKPKLFLPTIREPIYDTLATKTYNPNLDKSLYPRTHHAFRSKHIEDMSNTVPYLDCVDAQERVKWNAFIKKVWDQEWERCSYKNSTVEDWLTRGLEVDLGKYRGDIERRCSPVAADSGAPMEVTVTDVRNWILAAGEKKVGLGATMQLKQMFGERELFAVAGINQQKEKNAISMWFKNEQSVSLVDIRKRWSSAGDRADPDMLWELNEYLRRGIPPEMRREKWLEITCTDETMATVGAGSFTGQKGSQDSAQRRFEELLEVGRKHYNDAMYQLHEDTVSASAWDTHSSVVVMDMHLERLKHAQSVCIALIAYSWERGSGRPTTGGSGKELLNFEQVMGLGSRPGNQVAYTESLLVVAFFLLIAFEGKSTRKQDPEQSLEDMTRAFWMLYTLTGSPSNQQFREYWGCPEDTPHLKHTSPVNRLMIDRTGAMDDVFRLNLILARYEPELWTTMNALGFQLSTFFVGAFMRLFCFVMPTATVFRFWDLLFSDDWEPSSDRVTPPRHSLIDLAFGMLRQEKLKKRILEECMSAVEVRDCIAGFFESLYDPTEVIKITVDTELFLWQMPVAAVSEALHFKPKHVNDYLRAKDLWDAYPTHAPPGHLFQYRLQNMILSELVDGKDVLPKNVTRDPLRGTALTTRMVSTQVIPVLTRVCDTDGAERQTFGGMMRQLPSDKIRELGPDLNPQSTVSALWTMASRLTETVYNAEDMSARIALGMPPFPLKSDGEPTHMDSTELAKIVSRAGFGQGWFNTGGGGALLGPQLNALQLMGFGQGWTTKNLVSKIYDVFHSPQGRRMSLNEFFVALICCSKGTVGEKAVSLFHLFGHYDTPTKEKHATPETHTATVIIDKIEGSNRLAETQMTLRPPKDEVAIKEQTALHFKVWTHSVGSQEILLGEVFVPSLEPYRVSGGNATTKPFKIWGMESMLPPGVDRDANTEAGDEGGTRNIIGTMRMSIKWIIPQSRRNNPEVGQLGVQIHDIKFEDIQAPEYKNPRITLCMYTESGEEKQIKRWDPRSGAGKLLGAVTADIAYGGAFGEHMEWERTMRIDPLGFLHHRMGVGQEHGWNEKTQTWVWAKKWGDQSSVENLQVRRQFVVSNQATNRANTITLQACRYIVKSIMSRGLCAITNRQAALMSDQIFNRAHATPGIIDALVVQYDQRFEQFQSVEQLKQQCDADGRRYVDVRHQVILAHEKSVDFNMCDLTLFPGAYIDQNGRTAIQSYSFADMYINDPFPGTRKLLWIRYAQAGDGKRMNAKIPVDTEGQFRPVDLALDMDHGSRAGSMQMTVSKNEFVTCMMASPVLSETLRKLSTTDNKGDAQAKTREVNLEVVIADPTGQEEDDDFLDALNVRQRILFELYDSDMISKDDFLGECFLPPMTQLTTEPKTFALPIENYPDDDGGGQYTRPDPKKKLPKDEKYKCTGHLFVEASWKFPAEEVERKVTESKQARMDMEKKLHTGKLTIKIIKAEHIRPADNKLRVGMQNASSDAYVCAYVQNETYKDNESGGKKGVGKWGWRMSETTHVHEPIMKTSVKKGTLHPVWEEQKDIMLMTGSFEKRTKRTGFAVIHGRAEAEKQMAATLEGHDTKKDVKVYFGTDRKGARKAGDMAHGKPKLGTEDLLFPGQSREDKNAKVMAYFKETEGYRHSVGVYLGDSIHQFKKKLQMAAEREAEWERLQVLENLLKTKRDTDQEVLECRKRIEQYEAVAQNITHRHAVMVFVPTPELRRLKGGGSASSHAYKRKYFMEQADPSNWQPLDPIRTFSHYHMYGFGSMEHPGSNISAVLQVRISEGTDDYKLRNTRFRQFEEDAASWATKLEDTNDETHCWGYAKYRHPDNTVEWRQCLAERSEATDGAAKRRYQVEFIHTPLIAAPEVDPRRGGGYVSTRKVEMEEDDLLLGPPNANILSTGSLEHKEFLAKAPKLQMEGKTVEEIVTILNNEMRQKWQKTQEAEERAGGVAQTQAPTAITATDVRHTLQRDDAELATGVGTKGGATSMKRALLDRSAKKR